MTIEDRVRRVLAEAVADEPLLRGAPLDHALRRRSRRPVVAGAVVMAVVLAAVVALAAVRGQDERLLPSTVPTEGWKTYTDVAGNLRFRYPPGWRLVVNKELGRQGSEYVTVVPPGIVVPAKEPARFSVSVQPVARFWIGEGWFGTTSLGRLAGGQPYLRSASDPADTSGWSRPPAPPLADRPRYATWSIDWGRPCLTGAARCVPHSVQVGIYAADGRLWDRYRAVAETIPTTVEPLRPAAPTAGDRRLPACRSDQWRLAWVEEYGLRRGYQGVIVQGGVRYLRGPRCHLRLTLRLAVEGNGGRRLPVRGNPASTTVEGDLPLDGIQRVSGSWVIGGATMWRFVWDEWCNRGLPQASLRVTAAGGATLTVPGMDPAPDEPPRSTPGPGPCVDRGRPSVVAGWP
jgi:hypothetical protein